MHEHANFDHELFCQTPSSLPDPSWVTNDRALSYFVDAARVPDLIDWYANGYRAILTGSLSNRDIVLGAEDSIPPAMS